MPATLRYRLLLPFGVEIEKDLAQPLSAPEASQFVQLIRQHGLLLARDQALSMERQRELCAMLGPILLRPGETGTLSNEGGGPRASELSWHADAAYTEHPFDALSLHALDVVDGASSTNFIRADQAWGLLPLHLKESLARRTQEMVSPHYAQLSGRSCDREGLEAQKRATRPTVLIHPHDGRECIWVSALQTATIEGLSRQESCELLHAVFDDIYGPDRVLEHRWRRGDLVVWDNFALQHMRENLDTVGRRVLQRVIVGKEGCAPHIS